MPHGSVGLSKSNVVAEADNGRLFPGDGKQIVHGQAFVNLHVVGLDGRKDPLDLLAFADTELGHKGLYAVAKRTLDIVGAGLGLAVLSPFFLTFTLCSLISTGSPFFRHRRVGKSGKAFDCIKFRSMVKNADQVLQNLLDCDLQAKEEWLRDHKLKNDPRITRFGRFLRCTSLDELPQLWNVLTGDMTLVGPRPVVADELFRYQQRAKTYLSVRPGLTGLWQVSGRNNVDYRRRVAMDVCYVRAHSFTLDLYIIVMTIPAVFAKNGAY